MELEGKQALDQWAQQIASLDVAQGIIDYAERLAGDNRLSQADRDFAQAQADAVRRAIRRAKARRKKS